MKHHTCIGLVFALFASPLVRRHGPRRLNRREIRRGYEYPATDFIDRQRLAAEAIARRIEPDLKGDIARLPAYLEFFKKESVRDPRIFACDVSARAKEDRAMELSGFVEFPAHRQALKLLLTTLGFEKIEDRIEQVPEESLGEERFGIVTKPHIFLYDRTTAPRETLTECLYGEPLYLLRKTNDEHYWVQNSDGYVGYVAANDVVTRVAAKEFAAYQLARQAVLRTECDSLLGKLPPGSRVKLMKMRDPYVECESYQGTKLMFPPSAIVEVGGLGAMQKIEGAILAAQKLIGTKYVWGGRTGEGIDCSGLTQMAFKTQGINLPRDADQQVYVGRLVATPWYRDAMVRGDLMFFISRRGTIGHVAIYLGDNQYIEAADGGVKISSLNPTDENFGPRHERAFAFAKRVIE